MMLNGHSSEWREVSAGVPPGFSARGFIFPYINDLTDNLHCDVKLFADETSPFSLGHNEIESAKPMNRETHEKLRCGHSNGKCISMVRKLKRYYSQ